MVTGSNFGACTNPSSPPYHVTIHEAGHYLIEGTSKHMLEIDLRRYILKYKEICFADNPYDVQGCDYTVFNECKNRVDLAGFSRQEHKTLVLDLA